MSSLLIIVNGRCQLWDKILSCNVKLLDILIINSLIKENIQHLTLSLMITFLT